MNRSSIFQKVVHGFHYGLEVVEEKRPATMKYGGGSFYTSQLREWEDIDKIRVPDLWLDEKLAAEDMAKRRGDHPESRHGRSGICYSPWDYFMMWSDLDTLYDKMLYDEDWVHALMRRTLDVHLGIIGRLRIWT